MKNILLISLTLLIASVAFAADDQDAYCKYVLEQGAAQRDFLRTPEATSGIVQPNTGLPAQLLWGASSSYSSFRKAKLTMEVAKKNCELYVSTVTAQQQLLYALPSLEKAALLNRVSLIQQANSQLDALIAENTKAIEAQESTVPTLYALHAAKVKFFKDQGDTSLKAAALYTPESSPKPVKQLVVEKQGDEVADQKAIDHLARQQNWDLTFEGGMRHQINQFFANGVGPYVTFQASYSLANKAINRHLDSSADAYAQWKLTEQGDVVQNAAILKQQIVNSISVEESQLKSLQSEEQEIDSNLKIVNDVATSAAINFKNQLLADRLGLRVEIGDVSFRLTQLRQYLADNF
jgi:hypothetical protein